MHEDSASSLRETLRLESWIDNEVFHFVDLKLKSKNYLTGRWEAYHQNRRTRELRQER